MNTLNRHLHRIEQSISARQLPTAWRRQPTLGRYRTIGDVLEAIRTFRHPDANGLLLDLATVERTAYGIDGRTILVMALGRRLRMNYRRLNPADFDDALTDLAAVVCEPGAIQALTGKPSIADTLVRRAGRRAERQRATRHRYQTQTTRVPTDVLDVSRRSNEHGEMDDVVASRAALGRLRAKVEAAIESGAVSPVQWENLCDAVLCPAMGVAPTSPTRRNGSRARQSLARYIDDALAVA